jgi:hypothetical protein
MDRVNSDNNGGASDPPIVSHEDVLKKLEEEFKLWKSPVNLTNRKTIDIVQGYEKDKKFNDTLMLYISHYTKTTEMIKIEDVEDGGNEHQNLFTNYFEFFLWVKKYHPKKWDEILTALHPAGTASQPNTVSFPLNLDGTEKEELKRLEELKKICDLAIPGFKSGNGNYGFGPFSTVMDMCYESDGLNLRLATTMLNQSDEKIQNLLDGEEMMKYLGEYKSTTLNNMNVQTWINLPTRLFSFSSLYEFVVKQVVEPVFGGTFSRIPSTSVDHEVRETVFELKTDDPSREQNVRTIFYITNKHKEIGSIRKQRIESMEMLQETPYVYNLFAGYPIWSYPQSTTSFNKQSMIDNLTQKAKTLHAKSDKLISENMDPQITWGFDSSSIVIPESMSTKERFDDVVFQKRNPKSILSQTFLQPFRENNGKKPVLIMSDFIDFDFKALLLLIRYAVASTAYRWYSEYFAYKLKASSETFGLQIKMEIPSQYDYKRTEPDTGKLLKFTEGLNNWLPWLEMTHPTKHVEKHVTFADQIMNRWKSEMIESRDAILTCFQVAARDQWGVSLPISRGWWKNQDNTKLRQWPTYGTGENYILEFEKYIFDKRSPKLFVKGLKTTKNN